MEKPVAYQELLKMAEIVIPTLTDEQRVDLLNDMFKEYCKHCGRELHGHICHCMNDE